MSSSAKRVGSVGVLAAVVLCAALTGCPKPIPRIPLPGADASPPTVIWQIYNVQTKERRDISQDGQTVEVQPAEQGLVTLAVEDPESGVKEVTLTGKVEYTCSQGAQTEAKKYDLEPQTQKAEADQFNKVPVSASLVYVVELNKHGCKENWNFGGGTISLVGKGQNFVNGAQMKTLRLNLKKQS